MWKWLLGFFLVCVIICGGGAAIYATSQSSRDWIKTELLGSKPTMLRLESVSAGTITRTINAPGSIEPRTKVQVSAQVVARITELPFKEGQRVKKDDVIVRLDARDVAASLESAQAQLKAEQSRFAGAKASAEQAQRDLARKTELIKTGDETKAGLEESQLALQRAESARETSRYLIEVAKAQIVRASKDLENTTILAPIDGTITKRYAEVGELVVVGTLNNASSVIMELADLNTMIMKARVDEANIAPVKQGQRCKVFINAYTNREFGGSVEQVGLKRQVDRDGTGYFEVEVLVEKPADLVFGSGLTANVDVQVETLENVIRVPSQAVVDRRLDELPEAISKSEWVDRSKAFARVVYMIEDGKAKSVAVSTGMSDLTQTVIVGGVKVGDRIITGPFKVLVTLRDGQAIKEESKEKDKAKSGEKAKPEESNKGGAAATATAAGDAASAPKGDAKAVPAGGAKPQSSGDENPKATERPSSGGR